MSMWRRLLKLAIWAAQFQLGISIGTSMKPLQFAYGKLFGESTAPRGTATRQEQCDQTAHDAGCEGEVGAGKNFKFLSDVFFPKRERLNGQATALETTKCPSPFPEQAVAFVLKVGQTISLIPTNGSSTGGTWSARLRFCRGRFQLQ